MAELCDLQIHVNGQQTFFLNEKYVSKFSGKLRKIIKQEKRKTQIRSSGIRIDDFPGGPDGFELVSRFCYNNGTTTITVSNVFLLHCCALFLGMTEKVSASNLLQQTETFLEGMFYWSWNDLLTCLKSCESFFSYAVSSGLIEKIMTSLLTKIAQNSELIALSTSSSSSPEITSPFRFSSSTKSTTPEVLGMKPCSSNKTNWWFEDLTILPPMIIESFVKTLGAFGAENNSLVLTRFLLHYLKTATRTKRGLAMRTYAKSEYAGLADTAIYGVILVGSFSCRGLFWILRLVTAFGLSRDCRAGLERLIGAVLDQATLDDLLVSGHDGSVYDVNLVLRLIRVFVHNYDKLDYYEQKMKKVGGLIDKYLGEIAPDQSLKISRFLGVAESLSDCARDCFDGVYRAIDIYLESHSTLSLEERSRLCRCLNYEKLSLEACKELAKNPRIPPRVAVEALAAQHSNIATKQNSSPSSSKQMVLYKNGVDTETEENNNNISELVNDEMRLNLQRMQWRVGELEKVCRQMKGQMSRMGKNSKKPIISTAHSRSLPRLC